MLPQRGNAAYAAFMSNDATRKMSLLNLSAQKLSMASPEVRTEVEIGSPSNEEQVSTMHQSTTFLLNGGLSFQKRDGDRGEITDSGL